MKKIKVMVIVVIGMLVFCGCGNKRNSNIFTDTSGFNEEIPNKNEITEKEKLIECLTNTDWIKNNLKPSNTLNYENSRYTFVKLYERNSIILQVEDESNLTREYFLIQSKNNDISVTNVGSMHINHGIILVDKYSRIGKLNWGHMGEENTIYYDYDKNAEIIKEFGYSSEYFIEYYIDKNVTDEKTYNLQYQQYDGRYKYSIFMPLSDKMLKTILLDEVDYDAIYEESQFFSEGLAGVKKDGKWGYINAEGEEVIPCIYDSVYYFFEGRARVEKNGEYMWIDKAGEEIIGK